MTKEQFRENILKYADHEYEECVQIYAETGNCLWCMGDKKVSADGMDSEGNIEHGVETVACPICSIKKHDHDDE